MRAVPHHKNRNKQMDKLSRLLKEIKTLEVIGDTDKNIVSLESD